MLRIVTKSQELWDEEHERFVYIDGGKEFLLEHSLVSISKWEEKTHKCFMDKHKKSPEEIMDYILCMVVKPKNATAEDIKSFSTEDLKIINDYINDQASATVLNEKELKLMNHGVKGGGDMMTSEMIYYYMAEFRLPSDYQYWRLPRLLNLITLCNMKEWEKDPKNKKKLAFAGNNNMSMAKTYYEINKRRCAQMKTNG